MPRPIAQYLPRALAATLTLAIVGAPTYAHADELAATADGGVPAQDATGTSDIDELEPKDAEVLESAEDAVENDTAAPQPEEEAPLVAQASELSVVYRAHVQDIGTQDWVVNGGQAGTDGQSLRMESLRLELRDRAGKMVPGISAKAHVQNIGWTDWVSDGAIVGTEGQSLRVEALRIKLSDELAATYDIWYCALIQDYGWLGWAKNGEVCGSSGQSLRMESLRVVLQKKGTPAPAGASGSSFVDGAQVLLSGHVQNIGWQEWAVGAVGTSGQALRMEAVRAKLSGSIYEGGGITYRAHVQNEGWQDAVANGAVSGSEGKSQRVEAFDFKLTDGAEQHYDVWYRAHVQNIGWLGWAKNGEEAGSEGMSLRMEALQVKLLPKGSSAPSSAGSGIAQAFVALPSLSYAAGTTNGTPLKQLSASINIPNTVLGMDGSLSYQLQNADGAWCDWTSDGAVASAANGAKGARLKLSGDVTKLFHIWYRAHSKTTGWLVWASEGATVGINGISDSIDALELRVLPSWEAPENTGVNYKYLVPFYDETTDRDKTITKYLSWAVDIAQDDSHGYSQVNRWGPQDYDCSSLVIRALNQAGLDTGSALTTHYMLPELTARGWTSIKFTSESQLQRGDILLHPQYHTEFYLGASYNVGAHSAETGGIHGALGDQTGREISVGPYQNYGNGGWTYILRLE